MIRKIVIVGGGTAGWMTASYLRAAFGDRVDLTLIESARVPTIGVGEATFSTVRHFFEYLGLTEPEWMPACNATYKLGIRFENWREPGHHFYHPFERTRVVDGFPLTDWWSRCRPSTAFDSSCFVVPWLCEARRSPRHLDGSIFEQDFVETRPAYRTTLAEQNVQFPYAYHFDASLLAEFLAEYATKRGTTRIVDDVTDVILDERGWVDRVATLEHGEITGELFIDCSGTRSLLLNQALGEPFESFQDTLPNDRAVALRVPIDPQRPRPRPCTTATAMEAGWIWTIPLFNRIGTGYVYASDYCEPEVAERTLREFVGPVSEGQEANHIRMRVGRSRASWVNNCVAIGLASGFVEPLESTGIFFIHHAVEQLVKHFPDASWNSGDRDSYNRAVSNSMDGVREFLVLHYRGARRTDNEYWRDAKTRSAPDGLVQRMEQWRNRLPDAENIFPFYHGFEPYSYVCMLLGLGGVQTRVAPALKLMDESAAVAEFAQIAETARAVADRLPDQFEFLERQY